MRLKHNTHSAVYTLALLSPWVTLAQHGSVEENQVIKQQYMFQAGSSMACSCACAGHCEGTAQHCVLVVFRLCSLSAALE